MFAVIITINVCTCACMPAGKALQATKLCPKNPGPKLGGGRSDDAKEPESQTMKLIFLIGVFMSSPLSYTVGIIKQPLPIYFQFFAVVIPFGHSGCCCHASWTLCTIRFFLSQADSIQILLQHR